MHRWSEALTVGELGTKEREIEPGSKQAADRDEAEPREQPPIHSYLASRKTLVCLAKNKEHSQGQPLLGRAGREPRTEKCSQTIAAQRCGPRLQSRGREASAER